MATDQTDPRSPEQVALSKVPEVTLLFWINQDRRHHADVDVLVKAGAEE